MSDRHEALRALAEEWWDPPAELIDTLPKGGVQLRYLSHAWVRKALQDHDPDWYWEPMGYDDHGQPVIERDSQGNAVGLWIWLHVLGTKMPGYGSVEPGKRDAVKELIGDAIRNSAQPVCGGALWTRSKPEKPQKARKAAPKKEDAGEFAGIEEAIKPSGQVAYEALVDEFGKENVNGALATFKIAKFTEITPAKAEVLKASLKQRERLVKAQKKKDAEQEAGSGQDK